MGKPVFGSLTRLDTNWPVQSQKKTGSLKDWKEVKEEFTI